VENLAYNITMRILVSNDDGYQANGVQILASELRTIASRVDIVAPEVNRSASSSSLTLDRPLRLHKVSDNEFYVDGTPTDCVHLAVTGLLEYEPDMVVSGINLGSNLGDDVIYSGTVAAAIEGRFLGFPAIAISLTSWEGINFLTAAIVATKIIKQLSINPLPSDTILNINVPDLPLNDIKGLKITRLGNRHKSEPVIKSKDPRGNDIFWIGPPGAEQDCGPGTDFDAINNGYVSITPIHVDLTQYQAMDKVSKWIEGVSL